MMDAHASLHEMIVLAASPNAHTRQRNLQTLARASLAQNSIFHEGHEGTPRISSCSSCPSWMVSISWRRRRQDFLILRPILGPVVTGRHDRQIVVHLVPREQLAELGDEPSVAQMTG